MSNEAPSLRETLESAMNAEPAEVEPVEAPEVEAAPEVPAPDAAPTPAPSQERARDEAGRFAPKAEQKPAQTKAPVPTKGGEKADGRAATEAKGKPAAAAPSTAVAGAPAPVAPSDVKSPQSFRATTKELAKRLPAEFHPILEDSIRIDNEAKRALNESAQARHYAQQVQQSLAPYESIARAAGAPDAFTWAGSALQTVAGLYQGPPDHAIALAAQAVQLVQSRFGPQAIDRIAAILDGKAPQHVPQAQPQPQQQPQDVQALVQQTLAQERAKADAQAFLSSQPEFLDDVKDDMLALMERDRAKGGNMTWQQAYDRACKLNEDVASVLAQRKSADAARAAAPTVRQAKAAAVSVKTSPVSGATRPAGPKSLRETIEDAMQR